VEAARTVRVYAEEDIAFKDSSGGDVVSVRALIYV
jgi:hypothetical protein